MHPPAGGMRPGGANRKSERPDSPQMEEQTPTRPIRSGIGRWRNHHALRRARGGTPEMDGG